MKWVEFAAEFSNFNELQLPSPDEIGFLAYYSLDVMGITVLCVVLVVLALFYFVKYVVYRMWKFNNHKKVD